MLHIMQQQKKNSRCTLQQPSQICGSYVQTPGVPGLALQLKCSIDYGLTLWGLIYIGHF